MKTFRVIGNGALMEEYEAPNIEAAVEMYCSQTGFNAQEIPIDAFEVEENRKGNEQ